MKINRMNNADMIQYCNEALAWEELGPVDLHFFESVKRILMGECSVDSPDDIFDEEGFFTEDNASGNYYNPDGQDSIQV